MVNVDLMLMLAFGVLLLIIVLLNKKKVQFQKILFPLLYVVMYRTQLGLKGMDWVARKFKGILFYLQYVVVFVGFLGMGVMIFLLVKGMIDFLFRSAPSPVGILLPGVQVVPGLPAISFWHFILAIFILAIVHEFSHGIFARYYNVKVKSSGFAVFGIILPILPAAFVEPDEDQLGKKSKFKQITVFAAGSFANFVTAILFFLVFALFLVPAADSVVEFNDVQIVAVEKEFPAALAGVEKGENILIVNNYDVTNVSEFVDVMSLVKPGETIELVTDKDSYELVAIENPNNATKGYVGVFVQPVMEFTEDAKDKYGEFSLRTLFWFRMLFFWVWVANIGVGLFNLLPLGIVDGGKMFYLALLHFVKDEKRTKTIWKVVAIFLLVLILVALIPQFNNLIVKPLLSLVGKIF